MNDPTPVPPDPGARLTGSVEDNPASGPAFRNQKPVVSLGRSWRAPVLTLVVSLSAWVGYVLLKPPTFVSRASMWETVKLRLPEGAVFSEDLQNFLGTQSELLQSMTLRNQALALLRAGMNTTSSIPVERDGQPLPVDIRVTSSAKSTVFVIEASSSDPLFTQKYLDALMQVYLEYKKNVRQVISGDALASISEQVQRLERNLKEEQDVLGGFPADQQPRHVTGAGRGCGRLSGKIKHPVIRSATGGFGPTTPGVDRG